MRGRIEAIFHNKRARLADRWTNVNWMATKIRIFPVAGCLKHKRLSFQRGKKYMESQDVSVLMIGTEVPRNLLVAGQQLGATFQTYHFKKQQKIIAQLSI